MSPGFAIYADTDQIHPTAEVLTVLAGSIPDIAVITGGLISPVNRADMLSPQVVDIQFHCSALSQSVADGGAGVERIGIYAIQALYHGSRIAPSTIWIEPNNGGTKEVVGAV